MWKLILYGFFRDVDKNEVSTAVTAVKVYHAMIKYV